MRRSKMIVRVCLGVAAGSALGLVALEAPVSAAGTLEDFQSDTEFERPTNWIVIQDRVDLGVTKLGLDSDGDDLDSDPCTSIDQSSYANLANLDDVDRLWGPEGKSNPHFGTLGNLTHEYGYFAEWIAPGDAPNQYEAGPGNLAWWDVYYGGYGFGPADDYPADFSQLPMPERVELLQREVQYLKDNPTDPVWGTYEDNYDVAVLEGPGYGIQRASKVLQLYSWTDSYDGHVIHGPAVVSSDVFEVTGASTVSFKFSASADMDYFHVYAYLQDIDDCSNQIPIIPSEYQTGEYLEWQTLTADVDASDAGTYRFIFVGGTYDGTWGQMGGALLWIDDIGCTGDCEPVFCGDTQDDASNPNVDCEEELITTGPDLSIDQLELVGSEGGPRRPVQWVQDALAAETAEELPSTGSNTGLLSLAGALLVLGSGVIVLRRRQTATASSR